MRAQPRYTKTLLLFACLLAAPRLCAPLYAQGSITGQVITPNGLPASFVPVRVCAYTSTGTPCTPLSTIYADPGLTTPIANPTSTDQYGNYSVFAAAGTYIVQITPQAGVTYPYLMLLGGPGTGSVSSVALTMPSALCTVTGSPITTAGTLTCTAVNESVNTVYAGPATGSAAAPVFRALVTADLPSTVGTVKSVGLAAPNIFSISGSPVTASGTLTLGLATELVHTVWAGPATGSFATPGFRTLGYGELTGTPTLRYQTVDANGTPQTQQPVLNFLPRLTAVNASGQTNVDLATIGGLTPGSYTSANITVDQYGRVTLAANGSGGGGGDVTSFSSGGGGSLFSTMVSPSTGDVVQSFTLLNAPPVSVWGNGGNTVAAPGYVNISTAMLPFTYVGTSGSTLLPTAAGSFMAGDSVVLDTNLNLIDAGVPASTVNVAAQYAAPYYSALGSTNTISGIAPPTAASGTFVYAWKPTGFAVMPIATQLTADDILPGFSISTFTCSTCNTYELGAVVASPTNFTASYSSLPASASIFDGTNTDTLTTPFTSGSLAHSYTSATAACTTYTLTAVGPGGPRTDPLQSCWVPRSFGGTGTGGSATSATASGNNAVLVGATGTLTISSLGNSCTGQIYNVTTSGTQYVYLLLPCNVSNPTGGSFTTPGPTVFAMNTPTTITFTNQFGATVTMYLYRSVNSFFGSTNFIITVGP